MMRVEGGWGMMARWLAPGFEVARCGRSLASYAGRTFGDKEDLQQ
jgi:hypothetical protein